MISCFAIKAESTYYNCYNTNVSNAAVCSIRWLRRKHLMDFLSWPGFSVSCVKVRVS